MMLPQDVAAKLSVREFTKLCGIVETKFKQKFGIVSINRGGINPRSDNKLTAVIELDDKTRHTISLD